MQKIELPQARRLVLADDGSCSTKPALIESRRHIWDWCPLRRNEGSKSLEGLKYMRLLRLSPRRRTGPTALLELAEEFGDELVKLLDGSAKSLQVHRQTIISYQTWLLRRGLRERRGES